MDKESLFLILKILILYPLFFYLGYLIFYYNGKLSKNINILVIIIFTLILIHHLNDFIKMIKNVIEEKNFGKAFGFFIMCLATFLILFNFHKLLRINNFFKY
jgi:hypothetical protein